MCEDVWHIAGAHQETGMKVNTPHRSRTAMDKTLYSIRHDTRFMRRDG